jgi:hypothetical protein
MPFRGAASNGCLVWGIDRISLYFPHEWDVAVFWPQTPPPLADEQTLGSLERRIGQLAIRHVCRGKSSPLGIIDCLNRPDGHWQTLLRDIPGMRVNSTWSQILEVIRRQQNNKKHLNVLVYSCAPLPCLNGLHTSIGQAQLSRVYEREQAALSATTG